MTLLRGGDGLHGLPIVHRLKERIRIGKGIVLGLSSGSCLKLTTCLPLHARFLRDLAPSAFLPSSSSSQLLAKGFGVCIRVRSLLTQLFQGRDTLIFGDNCRVGTNVLPTIDSTHALVLTSGLMRTDVVSNVHLSTTGYVQCQRGQCSRLRRLLISGRTKCSEVVVMARDVFDVSNSRTSLHHLIALGRRCSGMLLCISRTRTMKIQKVRNLKYTRRRSYITSVSFLYKAFNGTLTSMKNCVIYSGAVHSCLVGGVHAFVFAATLPPIGLL